MCRVIQEALDVDVHDVTVAAELQLLCQITDREVRSALLAICVIAVQELRIVDRFENPSDGQLQQTVFEDRNPQWPLAASAILRNVCPPDQLGPGLLPLQPYDQPFDVAIEMRGVVSGSNPIHT